MDVVVVVGCTHVFAVVASRVSDDRVTAHLQKIDELLATVEAQPHSCFVAIPMLIRS